MEAMKTDVGEVPATADQYLTFLLGTEEYGVEILKVQEIKSWTSLTPLPNAPEYLLGVINLRGAIVPVVDLKVRFGLDEEEEPGNGRVIVIVRVGEETAQTRIVGLVVDRVSEVYHLEPSAIQEGVDSRGALDQDYVRGIGQIDNKMVILVNLEPIVSSSLDAHLGAAETAE